MNTRLFHLTFALCIIAGIASCYPVDDLEVEDLDVAVTLYDPEFYSPASGINRFEALQTFEVVDTILHILDEFEEDKISRKYDEFVLEQVRLNMLKLGFTEVVNPGTDTADVAITVSAMSSEHEVYYWYPYWGWYWGYPYKKSSSGNTYAYSYYYPWYPYGSYYTYQSGSVLMEMVDVARIDPEVEEIPVIWAGIVNGVIGESESGTKNRLIKGIDQCFNQSSYLLKIQD